VYSRSIGSAYWGGLGLVSEREERKGERRLIISADRSITQSNEFAKGETHLGTKDMDTHATRKRKEDPDKMAKEGTDRQILLRWEERRGTGDRYWA